MSFPVRQVLTCTGVLVIAVLGAFPPPVAASRNTMAAADTRLVATVATNGGNDISLKDMNGRLVSHLDPGTYTISVEDHSGLHNFHLFGPGVDRATTVFGTSQETWTVAFADGYYQYQCDPHRSMMHGAFTVGTGTAPPLKLSASVGPGSRIGMWTADGKKVSTLDAGKYVMTIHDRSRTDNFRLIGPSVTRSTGVRFRGTVQWSFTFAPGKYFYRSDTHTTLHGRFVATAGSPVQP